MPIRVTLSLVVLIAAVTDLRSRRIPNWLTLPAVPVGLTAQSIYGDGFWQGLLGALGGFAAFFVCSRSERAEPGRQVVHSGGIVCGDS